MTSPDPLAAILTAAEAARRRDRAASAAAVTTSEPAAGGNYTVGSPAGGSPVLTDDGGKVDPGLLYPAAIGATGVTYDHTQAVALAVWTIVHHLNGYPNVVVRDASGAPVIAEIDPRDRNTTVVRFSRPTAGTAELSL